MQQAAVEGPVNPIFALLCAVPSSVQRKQDEFYSASFNHSESSNKHFIIEYENTITKKNEINLVNTQKIHLKNIIRAFVRKDSYCPSPPSLGKRIERERGGNGGLLGQCFDRGKNISFSSTSCCNKLSTVAAALHKGVSHPPLGEKDTDFYFQLHHFLGQSVQSIYMGVIPKEKVQRFILSVLTFSGLECAIVRVQGKVHNSTCSLSSTSC